MITLVGTDDLDRFWNGALEHLKKCFKDDDPETVREFILDGTYQLWVTDHAAATTAINTFPIGKVLTVVHLGGERMWEWLGEGLEAIESWGRSQGCDRIRINGRDEWSRILPGYRKSAVVSEKVLT